MDTGEPMDVRINSGGNGLGEFTVAGDRASSSTVFVEDTPAEVYRDHIALVGKPERSDTSYAQYATPLWNSWAQLYGEQNQQNVIDWARALADAGLGGHALQIEESVIAADFDDRFPDLPALSKELKRLGFDLGMWTGLYMPETAAGFSQAVDNGYLLKDPSNPSQPCLFTWWNGRQTGLIDLANPAARRWYTEGLEAQVSDSGVAGFKFDTAFFDDRCAPYPGATRADYVRYGTELADEFDQQGAGLRVAWNAAQAQGFATRTADKPTTFAGLRAAVSANLAVSTIGYPFVETDMIGGSLQYPPPTKEVLARWAQAASLMPLMYASTSPTGVKDATTGEWVGYDRETVELYRAAIATHKRLAPYIWDQVQQTLKTGDPIMRPLFFDFPKDEAGYTVADEWMLGPAVLAAPKLDEGTTRDVFLPSGVWRDVNRGTVVRGPVTLKAYATPLGVTPAFVNLRAEGAAKALKALRAAGATR
jgi:alpha-glucosidase (family GH31 glycosyl hydrolase)